MKINKKPEDICKEKPKKKKDGYEFMNRATNHTKVELSWEKNVPDERLKALYEDELDEDIKLDEIIAPASEEEEEDEDDEEIDEELMKEQRRAALLSSNGQKSVYSDFDKSHKHNKVDIFFQNGLEVGNDDLEEDITFGKKVFSKNKRGFDSDEEDLDDEEGQIEELDVEEDKFFEVEEQEDSNKTKKQKKREKFHQQLKEKRKAKKMQELKRRRNVNLERRGNPEDEAKADLDILKDKENKDEFKPDIQDDRFGRLFKDHQMSIDPTYKKFDKEKAKEILKEKKSRKKLKTK